MRKDVVEQLWKIALMRQLLLRQAEPRPLRKLVTPQGTEYLDFASASYLGLSFDSRMTDALYESAQKNGVFTYCSPVFLRPPKQAQLEEALAGLTEYQDAVLFTTVTALHGGVLPALVRHYDIILVDEFAHQSIHDALKIAGTRRIVAFRHNSVDDVCRLLSGGALGRVRRPLLITDGVFSMSGEVAPLEQLSAVVSEANGTLYVDDSHGFGVLGKDGEGLSRLLSRLPCDSLYVASMSKALATPVAFVATDRRTASLLRTQAHTCLFSGNVPIVFLDVAAVALNILTSKEGAVLRERLASNVEALTCRLRQMGGKAIYHGGGIVALGVENSHVFETLCLSLDDRLIAFNPVMFPAIPKGEFRARFCLSASHSLADIENVVSSLKSADAMGSRPSPSR